MRSYAQPDDHRKILQQHIKLSKCLNLFCTFFCLLSWKWKCKFSQQAVANKQNIIVSPKFFIIVGILFLRTSAHSARKGPAKIKMPIFSLKQLRQMQSRWKHNTSNKNILQSFNITLGRFSFGTALFALYCRKGKVCLLLKVIFWEIDLGGMGYLLW